MSTGRGLCRSPSKTVRPVVDLTVVRGAWLPTAGSASTGACARIVPNAAAAAITCMGWIFKMYSLLVFYVDRAPGP